jgi:hypothetical protein
MPNPGHIPMRVLQRACGALAFILMVWNPASALAQSPESRLEGMWSDPPTTPEGEFCMMECTDAGIARLNELLDNPANDARPFDQLQTEARAYEREYLRSRLTDDALKSYPIDQAENPPFLRCEPPGIAQQMFMPHQLEIRKRGNDRIELHYGEWDARRTVYMDGRNRPSNQPATAMGFSVGHFDGETLVVETSGITANIAGWPRLLAFSARHSDQLRIVERFTRSSDGKTLLMAATIQDPWSLREPIVLKKMWRWAPESRIAPYKDCQKPTEFKKGATQ